MTETQIREIAMRHRTSIQIGFIPPFKESIWRESDVIAAMRAIEQATAKRCAEICWQEECAKLIEEEFKL